MKDINRLNDKLSATETIEPFGGISSAKNMM